MGTFVIKLPDVGEGIAEAEIAEWNVKPGDYVREDDVLGSVMTDKATVEIPSPVDGKILWLTADVGVSVAIGSDFVKLEVSGEGNVKGGADTASATAPEMPEAVAPEAAKAPPTPAPTPEPPAPEPTAPKTAKRAAAPPSGLPRPMGEKPIAAPAVRLRAREMGIDLRFVHGTGPAGRITHEDVDDYASGAAAPAGRGRALVADTSVVEKPVIGLRRKIAAKMQESKRRIPHITYVEEINVTEVEALRAHLNETKREDQPRLTMLPFLMRAIVLALRDFPEMSALFDDDAGVVRQFGAAHIGVAAQTPAGLVVAVVKHAEARDLWDCAAELKRLTDAARDAKATREELSGSTITITSLGSMGGLATTPIINHPEVAIIGVNKIRIQPVYRDGGFVPSKIMNLSSSFDHRVIDGWDAAAFVQRIKALLEHPATIFMEG